MVTLAPASDDIGGLLGVVETQRMPSVREMGEFLAQFEQSEMPVDHGFSDGIYFRTIFMPAGTAVIGHMHKTRHMNVILMGRAIVTMNGERHEIVAPTKFESGAGVQKILLIQEDMLWMTIHANPDDCRDIPALEAGLVELPASVMDKPENMTLDDYRMLLTRIGLALK